MSNKPGIPSGTRDFLPSEVLKRNYIIDTIRGIYARYGYQPLETPAMENLSTLLGKYGDEGDKLLYRILNSGDFLKKANDTDWQEKNISNLAGQLAEKGLRYDLTVPFARFVVMNRNELTFPFKRYQIQPVWRADRPQKGRYREFYQCDADVIGSKSLLLDAEMVLMIRDVFEALKMNVTVRLNNRKILDGLSQHLEAGDNFQSLVMTMDKADKIGIDGVVEELTKQGFSEAQTDKLKAYLGFEGDNRAKIRFLKETLLNETGKQGVDELEEVMERLAQYWSKYVDVTIDLTLARGLSYYTGTIYETVSRDVQMGSILGGGRYDDLTGVFGLPDTSGVGISFGLDRIYDIMSQLDLFPSGISKGSDVLFIPMDRRCELAAMHYADQFRHHDLSAEIYPDLNHKMGKKFKYADQKGIAYAIIIGEEEFTGSFLTVKDMASGEQKQLKQSEAIEVIKGIL